MFEIWWVVGVAAVERRGTPDRSTVVYAVTCQASFTAKLPTTVSPCKHGAARRSRTGVTMTPPASVGAVSVEVIADAGGLPSRTHGTTGWMS
jgi:hypothetical protein